jgi:hypothetical protein
MDDVLQRAFGRARQGYAVFFATKAKVPTSPHGVKDATADVDTLRGLHRRYGGTLICIATGEASGFDAVDFDAKHPAAHEYWLAIRDHMPRSYAYRTRGRGFHVWLQHHEGVRNSAGKLARGVDTRGTGGYVIDWVSAGLPVLDPSPPAPWPTWLLDQILSTTAKNSGTGATACVVIPDDCSIRRLYRFVAASHEGERNSRLHWASCRLGEMCASGLLERAKAAALLIQAATSAGLPEAEATATAWSALGGG